MKLVEVNGKNPTLASLLRMAKKQPLVLTRGRKPLVAILDVGRDDVKTLSLRANRRFLAYLKQCRERHQREGGIRLEDVRVQYDLPPRARRRRRPAR